MTVRDVGVTIWVLTFKGTVQALQNIIIAKSLFTKVYPNLPSLSVEQMYGMLNDPNPAIVLALTLKL